MRGRRILIIDKSCARVPRVFAPFIGSLLRSLLRQQSHQIEPVGEHRKVAVGRARPFLARPVPIQFDAVLVGVAQVKRLADSVVAGAVQNNARFYHAV